MSSDRRRRLPGARGAAHKKVTLATWVVLVWMLAPVAWLLSLSVKNGLDATAIPPVLMFVPTLENYSGLLESRFLRPLLNSVIISVSTTTLAMALGLPAAYVLSRSRSRLAGPVSFWILTTRMAPPIAFAIPLFLAYRRLGWIDTLHGLVIIHLTFSLPLVIWLMRTFFAALPVSLEEAARIDGASRWQTFSRIVLPLSAPGLATAAIFSFLLAWNDFFYSLVLARRDAIPVTIAIANAMNYYGWDWGRITAGSMVVTAPVVIFSILLRRYFVRGLTAGALKG